MSFRFVNFMIGMGQWQRASGARCSGYGLCALTLALACGSNVVDAGALPEPVNGTGGSGASDVDSEDVGGADAPDAGGDVRGSGCAIADLGRYRLVFDSDGGRLERRIYSMRADGTELEALTPPGEIAREPALSPDGRQLAYVTPEGIRVLSLATGESELLVAGGDQPSWSADGSRLFHRMPSEYGNALNAITIADGSSDYLTSGVQVTDPEVSSDGSSLVYALSAKPDAFGIELAHAVQAFDLLDRPRSWTPVQPSSLRVSHPTISPDNVWLGAAIHCQNEAAPSLWLSPLAVPTLPCEGRRVTAAGAPGVSNPKWGPGVLVAYERGTPPRDIAIVAADTGDECVIQAPGDNRNPSWAPLLDFQSPQ
jgi:Tol biopolymer transport system component